MVSTWIRVTFFSTCSGISSTSFSFSFGSRTVLIPPRCAASRLG